MRNIILSLLVLMFLASCQTQSSKTEPLEESYQLTIKGMTCTGCENAIEKSVTALDGVKEVQSSYEDGEALIKADFSKTDTNQIRQAIEKKGYKVIRFEKM